MNKEISSLNNIITEIRFQLEEISNKVKENHNEISMDSQKIENRLNVIYEGKKFMNQKLTQNERFLKDSLAYMVRYGDVMDNFIDTRICYLFKKKTNSKQKPEKIIDNKDISVDSLQNNKDWGQIQCKKFFLILFPLNLFYMS